MGRTDGVHIIHFHAFLSVDELVVLRPIVVMRVKSVAVILLEMAARLHMYDTSS